MKDLIGKITQGDCLELMKGLPNKCIDLVLTDPPYGIGDVWMKSKKTYRFRKQNWNNSRPGKEIFEQIFRVSKNQIIWGGNYFTDVLPPTNSWLIWRKDRDVDKTFMSEFEIAWTSLNIPMQEIKCTWDGAKKGPETGIKTIHPTQRPVFLYAYQLDRWSNENDLILDPFSGSGSVSVAAYKLRRRFICFEKDPKYVELSQERLKQVQAQMEMF